MNYKIYIILLIGLYINSFNAQTNQRTLGNKSYEVSNHLGNVMVAVSDRKTPAQETTTNMVAFNETDIKSYNDYYPYGMVLEKRNGSSNYRFGFQGQEKDDEIKGKAEIISFQESVYDTRLIRWLKIDNHQKHFQSNYVFAKGNPIVYVDPDGNDDFYFNKHGYIAYRVPTGSAPRFFRFQEQINVVQVSKDHIIGVSKMVPIEVPYNRWIMAQASYGDEEMTMAIADNYSRAGDIDRRMDFLDAGGAITIGRAHDKHSGLIWGLAGALALPLAVEYIIPASLEIASASAPIISAEVSLISESTPIIWNGLKTTVAANALGGSANAVYEVSSAAISTGDIGNTNLTSVLSGYTCGPLWSSAFSSYLPYTTNNGLSYIDSYSDFESKTFDFIIGYGVGQTTDKFLGPLKSEISNSPIKNDESGEAIFKFFEFSIESTGNIINDGIKNTVKE